jgi:hypothetical protein
MRAIVFAGIVCNPCYDSCMLRNLDPGRRLVVYIVVNIIVSALTTLIVMALWTNYTLSNEPLLGSLPSGSNSQAVSQMAITAIIGAGDLANEHVTIEYNGSADISLAGWRLRDQNGNEYRFPALVLHPGASVDVFSGQGANSATSLYWGRMVAVWVSGELATLLDATGQTQATYLVP